MREHSSALSQHHGAVVRGRLAGLEALRGIAAVMVVLFHAGVMLNGPKDYPSRPFHGFFAFGRAGVDVFFVLSGFIITLIHAGDIGQPHRLNGFVRKRLVRIFPSYWIVSLMLLAIMLISPTPDRREHDPMFVLRSFFLLPDRAEPLLGVGWSLRLEILFYAIFATRLVNAKLGVVVLSAWFAPVLLNCVVFTLRGTPLFGGLWGREFFTVLNAEFLFGIWAAQRVMAGATTNGLRWLVAGVALFAVLASVESFGPAQPLNWPPLHLAYALATALMLCGLVGLERARRLHVSALLVTLGTASYALYLLHVVVISVGVFTLRKLHLEALLPVDAAYLLLVIASISAAIVFERYIERPLLARFR